VIFSGIGYDQNGNWGLLDDLWKYNSENNSWQLLKGERKVVPASISVDIPSPRRNAITWSDNKGSFWLMGGKQLNDTDYLADLWKYNSENNSWTRISPETKINVSPVWGKNKGVSDPGIFPGSRAAAASCVDKMGRLWLFGGIGRDYARSSEDVYNDLWVYEPDINAWTWVAGTDGANQKGIFPSKEN
jgi:N-acetylneuraminic acid mutarotase